MAGSDKRKPVKPVTMHAHMVDLNIAIIRVWIDIWAAIPGSFARGRKARRLRQLAREESWRHFLIDHEHGHYE